MSILEPLQVQTPVLQRSLSHKPVPRLPGTGPLEMSDWLRVDDAYEGQMAERERLMTERPDEVHAILPEGRPAADELLRFALDHLPSGFSVVDDRVTRPDGKVVSVDPTNPLLTLGHLLQEDFCLMEKGSNGEHVLTGAILCFPSHWTLSEKIGRSMVRIHRPVAPYTNDVARRVQRLFDGVQVGRPLWRCNGHGIEHPELFMPRREGVVEGRRATAGPYIRSERQAIVRLPQTRAVAFSIHTTVIHRRDVAPADLSAFGITD